MTELPPLGSGYCDAALLERALSYALGAVHAVAPDSMACPTPCRRWNLRTLLEHLIDSLAALHEGLAAGCVGPGPVGLDDLGDPSYIEGDPSSTDLGTVFRDRAGRLLGALCAEHPPDRVITIRDRSLTVEVAAGAGAIEIAAHGWDVARACGRPGQIPPLLAVDLLEVSRLVITEDNRHPFFGRPVDAGWAPTPSDRLVAFLGRNPQA
jgi:uncharacterized protein (TIGR03086 family)